MHRKYKYFGREVKFNRVIHAQLGDPNQFLTNHDSSSKLRQYNIDKKYTNFLRKIPNCRLTAGNLVLGKVYLFLAPAAGFWPFN